MKYFGYLTEQERKTIFFAEPGFFRRDGNKHLISYALGATLYMPAIRENIAEDIISKKNKGLISVVFCLEDAISDHEVEKAEQQLSSCLRKLYSAVERGSVEYDDLPFIFVRVRYAAQISKLCHLTGAAFSVLSGFVFPKFSYHNGQTYFKELSELNDSFGKNFYGMPILETPDIIHWETRRDSLIRISEILEEYRDLVLNIRIGATDLSSIFGIRRGFDVTVYDIQVLRDCITDIINNFCRVSMEYVVSGPVWEYFLSGDRVLKPKLRITPFQEQYGEVGTAIRSKLLNQYLDGLIYEVLLDKANGLIGKTVIHPSHIIPVQSMYVVDHEEYTDACSILENNGKTGVMKSSFQNKMNETKPHMNWAKKILRRAKVYGVFNKNQEFVNLL
ncbi:MAG: citrate lyase subunit beta [Desulfobacteraceae bacterium 4572_88]|nr:MAG: citrate lyase subunit beta [Desulfobacteraceae bacterium 4572_88]